MAEELTDADKRRIRSEANLHLVGWLEDAEAQLSVCRDVVEAAREVINDCNLSPDRANGRKWCITHQEWTPCPMATLRDALAALPPTPDDIARANEAYRTSCDCGGDPHLPGCPAALPPTERGENPGYGIVQDRLHEPSMALIDTCTCGDPWPCPERGEG